MAEDTSLIFDFDGKPLTDVTIAEFFSQMFPGLKPIGAVIQRQGKFAVGFESDAGEMRTIWFEAVQLWRGADRLS